MPKYIIRWNTKDGQIYEEIEDPNLEEAKKSAYRMWMEDAAIIPDCEVMGNSIATDKMREDYL